MSRRRPVSFLAVVLFAALASAGEKSIEDFLPAEAILSVGYYGDNPDFAKTELYQLAQEPEVKEWLQSITQLIAAGTQLAAAGAKVNFDLLRPLLSARVGLAILPGEARGVPKFLAVAKVDAANAAARTGLTSFLKQAQKTAGGGAERKVQVGGIEVTQLGLEPLAVCFGFQGDYLLVGSTPLIIGHALAPDVPKLAGLPGFRRLGTAGSPIGFLVYNHEVTMEHQGAGMGRDERAILDGFGLNQVRTVGVRLGAEGRALVGTLAVHTVVGRRGLAKAFAAPPVDMTLLRFAPRDTSVAWVSNVDPTDLYQAVVGIAHALGAMTGDNVRGSIAEFEGAMGVSLDKDVFGLLGRGTVITTSGPSLLPAPIVSTPVKEGERFDAAVAKLVAALDAAVKEEQGKDGGAQLKTIHHGQHAIRYLALPRVAVPYAPCYTLAGDRLVFALSPIHLKDYLAFLDQHEPSVLDNPRFKELAPLVPKNANSVAFTDTGDQFAAMYRLFGPMLTMAQGIPGVPIAIDLANLPSVRTVRRHLFDSISYGYATEDMIVDECRSPFGIGFLAPIPAVFSLSSLGFMMAAMRFEGAGMNVDDEPAIPKKEEKKAGQEF